MVAGRVTCIEPRTRESRVSRSESANGQLSRKSRGIAASAIRDHDNASRRSGAVAGGEVAAGVDHEGRRAVVASVHEGRSRDVHGAVDHDPKRAVNATLQGEMSGTGQVTLRLEPGAPG